MSPVVNAVIAAAGLGSRLGMGMPKAMIEIDGRPLLGRLVAALSPHVENIHVVVGYREELILELCARHHRQVVLVRNPRYRSTTTAQSYALGARHLAGKTLFIDGDLLLRPASLAAFLSAAASFDLTVGVTDAKSENAVFADLRGDEEGAGACVAGFSREPGWPHEWANVVAGPADLMEGATGYVFEHLAPLLPAPAVRLELAEVDTAADLELAVRFARGHGL